MTEHMLYQLSADNQKDILAAEKGDKVAEERITARRNAAIAVTAVAAGGYALVYGGHILIAGSAEMATAGRIALEGCKANPALCLNNVGIFVADAVAPEAAVGTGVLAAGAVKVLGNSKEGAKNLAEGLHNAGMQVAEALTPGGVADIIGVGKTAAEAAAAKIVVASTTKSMNNAAHNAANYAGLKMDLKTTQAANEVVESLKTTGQLPKNYVTKNQAIGNGWKPGKALNNTTPGGQLGGDIFENSNNLLPPSLGRVWREADIGLDNTMSRGNQPGTRLLYSNDGLLYITVDHYETAISIGKWK
ncbi:hypothetical protein [Photorhabdus sp. RM71S]|uniref:hypothetical protein n=1 Tax=Photorhabdus sp. RM71S TaxID=3342824 RepID=UPI0036DB4269